MPDGTQAEAGEAARASSREGMILVRERARDRRGRRGDPRARRADGRRARARHAARGGAADRHRGARARDHARTGPTASASTGSRASCTPRPARRWRPRPGREDPGSRRASWTASRSASSVPSCARASPPACSRTSRSAPSPLWLKARLIGGRAAPDQQRRRHHQLRDAADRPAAARLRPRPRRGRRADRPPRRATASRCETLDGQTRTLDGEMVVIDDADGPDLDRGGDGRRALGGRSPTPRACCSRSPHGTGRTSTGPPGRLGLRSEASGALREGPRARAVHPGPGGRRAADGRAVRREHRCPARSTSAASGPPPQLIRCARRASSAILGVAVALAAPGARSSAALGLRRSSDAERRPGVSVPPLRRDDVTREVDLIEEVARIDGLERLPATLPARRGAAGRLSHSQRVRRPRRGRAGRARACTRSSAGASPSPALLDRLRIAAGPPDAPRRGAREPAVGGPVDHAPDAASARCSTRPATTSRATARHRASSSRAPSTAPRARTADRYAATNTTRSAALLSGARSRPLLARGSRGEADFFAAKGLLGGAARALRRRLVGAARAVAVPAPGAQRGGAAPASERSSGFVGELHPLVAGAWDLERDGGLRDRPRACSPRCAPEVVAFSAFGAFPALRQDLAVTLPREVPAAEVLDAVREAGGGDARATREIFDVYTGAQVGEGRRSLALRARLPRPERTLTDEDVAPVRGRIVAALGEMEASCVASTPQQSAPGAPRVARRGRHRLRGRARGAAALAPPRLRAGRRSPAARRSGGTLEELYPRYRVPLAIERARPGGAARRSTRRSSPTRTRRRRRPSRRCSSAARASSTSAPTSACATLETYERWYGPHPRPELLELAVYGLTELHREAIAGAALVANPGCYPTATLLALAPLARGRADRRRRDRRQAGHLRRRAGPSTRRTHLSMAGENILPYKVAAHRHTPEIEEQLALPRPLQARREGPVPGAPRAARPGRAAACYVTPTRPVGEDGAAASCTRPPTPRSRSSRSPSARPGRARCARQLLPDVRGGRLAHRQGARVLRDRQPLEGHLLAGGRRTST